MKVIVAGSRDIDEPEDVYRAIRAARNAGWAFDEVVTGGARGPDTIAHEAAAQKGVPTEVFEAAWGKYGKAAGPIRNEQMADYADALVAIWDGQSPGTRNMIQEALGRKMPVFVYRP